TEIPIPFEDIKISPHGLFVAGITSQGKVFVWRAQDKLSADSKPTLTLPIDAKTSSFHFEFSPDEKWIYAQLNDGRVYVWRPGDKLSDAPQPYLVSDGNVDTYFSPRGTYIASMSGTGKLLLRRLGEP